LHNCGLTPSSEYEYVNDGYANDIVEGTTFAGKRSGSPLKAGAKDAKATPGTSTVARIFFNGCDAFARLSGLVF
jgi:hypothetical protein